MKNIAILPVFIILFSLAFLSCPVVTNEDPDVKKVTAAEEELTLQTKTYDLSVYKKDAKANLTAYVETLNPDDYSYYNWKAIIDIADIGKENIDMAIDKQGVDSALAAAKEEIDMIDKDPFNLTEYIEEEAELVEWTGGPSSSFRTLYFRRKNTNENIIFNCAVDNGVLGTDDILKYGKNISIISSEILLWANREIEEDGTYKHFNNAFIEIILTQEENYIGYVVIEVNFDKKDSDGVIILKSVIFPQIDDIFQIVTEEYIITAIEKIKNQTKGGD